MGRVRLCARRCALSSAGLGVANIVTHAKWHEVEDGVFWGARAEGVTAVEVAAGSAGARAGIERGDLLLAVNGAPIRDASRRRRIPAHRPARHAPHLHARPSRHAASNRSRAGGRAAGQLDVLRARGGRAVHAARRRVGAPEAAARSGDAAFLLAVRRLLRRVHLLVQRAVRSPRLGVLLGRRSGAGAAAAAAAAFHAGLPAAAIRRTPSVARAGGAHVFAGRRSWCRARHRARPRPGKRRHVFDGRRGAGSAGAGVPVLLRDGSARRARASLPADDLGDGAASASLDRVGNCPGRWSVCLRLRAAVGARHRSAAPPAVDGDSSRLRAAHLCVGDRSLPAPGCRSHREARTGLCGLRGGHGGARPGDSEDRSRSFSRPARTGRTGSSRFWRRR